MNCPLNSTKRDDRRAYIFDSRPETPSRAKRRAGRFAAALLCAAAVLLAHVPASHAQADMTPKLRVKVTAVRQTVLSSQLGGRLQEVTVRDGDSFTKGQVLAKMDCAMERAQLNRARAAVSKQNAFFQATQKLEKMKSRSPLELAAARADAAQAEAELLMTQVMVGRCEVKAPFDGRVGELMVRENQFVSEGQPLFEVLDPSELELEFIVPSHWLPWFVPEYVFSVTIDETGKAYPARLARLGGKVDAVSQSIKVYARFDSPDPSLLPGMSGEAHVTPPANLTRQ